jgi:hypothetical protein
MVLSKKLQHVISTTRQLDAAPKLPNSAGGFRFREINVLCEIKGFIKVVLGNSKRYHQMRGRGEAVILSNS